MASLGNDDHYLEFFVDPFEPVNCGLKVPDISVTHLELLLKLRDLAQMGFALSSVLCLELVLCSPSR